MAPPGPKSPPPPRPSLPAGVSWANVVSTGPKPDSHDPPLHLRRDHFEKLKKSTASSVTIGLDLWLQAKDSMQTSLYAKFLGKALPLEQAKLALDDAWRGIGDFSITDLPNGFYFIKCKTSDMQERLLGDGPWNVAGRILQLSPWSESFQPAFEKLSNAAVWIQIYHFPMELWGGEILELVASQFGKVLKVDAHTLDRSRAKFARVCVENNLEQPLQQGTWVNYGGYSVFVLVLYERIPVFCYKCGRIGHGEANCSFVSSHQLSSSSVPSGQFDPEPVHMEPEMLIDEVDKGREGSSRAHLSSQATTEADGAYGPWLKPNKRHVALRGRGGSRGGGHGGSRGGGHGGTRRSSSGVLCGDDGLDLEAWPLHGPPLNTWQIKPTGLRHVVLFRGVVAK